MQASTLVSGFCSILYEIWSESISESVFHSIGGKGTASRTLIPIISNKFKKSIRGKYGLSTEPVRAFVSHPHIRVRQPYTSEDLRLS